jgi:hypothetical protein
VKARILLPLVVVGALLAGDARADDQKPPPSTAMPRIVGGAVAFGAAYAVMLPFATSDDLAFRHRPFAVPIYGPLVTGAKFVFEDSEWAPLTTALGLLWIADSAIQVAGLVVMTTGIVDAAREPHVTILPRVDAHGAGAVVSIPSF